MLRCQEPFPDTTRFRLSSIRYMSTRIDSPVFVDIWGFRKPEPLRFGLLLFETRGGAPGPRELQRLEGLLQCRLEVLVGFDTNRETDQTIGDTHLLASFRRQCGMGHQRRMLDQ